MLTPLSPEAVPAQAPALPLSFPTPAERADYLSFTAPEAVGPYLGELAAGVDGLSVDTLPGPVPIPIARLSPAVEAGAEGDQAVLRVLIVGAQHGTERAGLEVGLRLARDLTAGRLAALRRRLEVRIVPMANPRGVGQLRLETPDGVDLDRDHIRLAAPETRALWSEYVAWRPHLVLDLHEIGPSEYPVQIGVPTHPNAPGASMFARYYLLPFTANELAGVDVPFHEYVAEWRDGRHLEGAASPAPHGDDGSSTWFTPPPLGPSSARNAFALAGSVTFFIAVSSSRDIIGLEQRTERLHLAVRALLTAAAGLASELLSTYEVARVAPKGQMVLDARYVADDSAAALPWIFINDRGQRGQGHLAPWRSVVEIRAELETPVGWWIGPHQDELTEALLAHGFRLRAAGPDDTAFAYPRCAPAERDDALRAERELVASAPPAGAQWVAADQPGGRLLFTMIEPWSEGGWFSPEGAVPAPDSSAPAPTPACDEGETFPVFRVPR